MKKTSFYEKYIKRSLDLTCYSLALLIFSPLISATAVLVKMKLGSPVLFVQERPGKNNKIFKLYKFRTMSNAKDENGELLPDTIRLTKFGKFLRSTSIDELPELFNIIKGEMSVVGPRPLSVKYLPYYTKKEIKRHDVRPGLTGLAQINGRNAISWEKRFKYDLYYTKNVSLGLDLYIILKTILKVFFRENIAQGEECPISLDDERMAFK